MENASEKVSSTSVSLDIYSSVITTFYHKILKNYHTNKDLCIYYIDAILDWLVNTPFHFLSVLLNRFHAAKTNFKNLQHCFKYFLF